jgi:hypothetical protein
MNYPKIAIAVLSLLATTTVYAISYRQPLTIDNTYVNKHGSIISGNYEGTLAQPAITINTSQPIIIESANLTGPGDLISGANANLTIRNTIAVSTNPNVIGTPKGAFLRLSNIINLRVENCQITGSSFPFFIAGYSGNHTSAQTLKILHNTIKNVDARPSDGNGGYTNPTGPVNSYGIQLVYINNLPGAEIAWNEIINDGVNGGMLAMLQFFDSGGISTSHFLVHDNIFKGAYGGAIAISSLSNDSTTGVPAFIDIFNNQLIGLVSYGIQLYAGHDNNVFNNRIVSSGYSTDGVFVAGPNAVGLINLNFLNQLPSVFFNNHIHDNLVGFLSNVSRSDWSLPGQNNNTENNVSLTPIDNTHPTLQDEFNEYQLWLKKRGFHHIKHRIN